MERSIVVISACSSVLICRSCHVLCALGSRRSVAKGLGREILLMPVSFSGSKPVKDIWSVQARPWMLRGLGAFERRIW